MTAPNPEVAEEVIGYFVGRQRVHEPILVDSDTFEPAGWLAAYIHRIDAFVLKIFRGSWNGRRGNRTHSFLGLCDTGT
jgi:hypothetical protein